MIFSSFCYFANIVADRLFMAIHLGGWFFSPCNLHQSFQRLFFHLFSCFLFFKNHFSYKMEELVVADVSTKEVKKANVRRRCTAKTILGKVCQRKQEADCSYCKQHGEMLRVHIPVYRVMTSSTVSIYDLKPCPSCTSNLTCGEVCATCSQFIAY